MLNKWIAIGCTVLATSAQVTLALAPPTSVCIGLTSSFIFTNTTVMSASKVAANTTVATQGSCQSSAVTGLKSICRVVLRTNTSDTSRVIMEAWLPDEWSGRFAGAGNGGLGGCG